MPAPHTPLLRRHENWVLVAYFAVVTFQTSWGAWQDIPLPKRVSTIDAWVQAIMIAQWVMFDSARRGLRRPFIFGFFLLVAWPVVAPFHLWRTRRWQAWKTTGIFIGLTLLSVLPYIIRDFAPPTPEGGKVRRPETQHRFIGQ